MVYILVKGTTVIDWSKDTPLDGNGRDIVPFEVEDDGFLETLPKGKEAHWDGEDWWAEDIQPTTEDLVAAIMELADIVAGGE